MSDETVKAARGQGYDGTMNSSGTPNDWLHDEPSDRWWRRFGHWIYMGACALPMALVPPGSGAPEWLIRAIDWLPALRGLLAASPGDGRIVVWILASVMAYPIMHIATRARIDRRLLVVKWKGLLSVLFFNVVFFGFLWVDLVSLRGNYMARYIRAAMLSDGLSMIFVAPLLSLAYAFLMVLNFYTLLSFFTDIDKEN